MIHIKAEGREKYLERGWRLKGMRQLQVSRVRGWKLDPICAKFPDKGRFHSESHLGFVILTENLCSVPIIDCISGSNQ